MEVGAPVQARDGLRGCLVRVCSDDGKVHGAGVLIADGKVLTCAHVVAQAQRNDRVRIDFPLTYTAASYWAEVEHQHFSHEGYELDAALLRVPTGTQLPSEAAPARLLGDQQLERHRFWVYGFPGGHDEGVWHAGTIVAQRAFDWQLQGEMDGSYRITHGFSGAPVWDETLRGVVGIIHAGEKNPAEKAAFMLPSALLSAAGVEVRLGAADPALSLLHLYRTWLQESVSTVRVFGEQQPRPLDQVFFHLRIAGDFRPQDEQAEWLGRLNTYVRQRQELSSRAIEQDEDPAGRRRSLFTPDELLGQSMHAVVLGSPGSGKSTLLQYLALQTVQRDDRFPIFLEFKSLEQKHIDQAGDFAELIFERSVARPLNLSRDEQRSLRDFFLKSLNAGEVVLFLDGLDELSGAPFFESVRRLLFEFLDSRAGRATPAFLTARPYLLKRVEGMQMLEIQPLTLREIRGYMEHYFGGENPKLELLMDRLRQNMDLRDLASVPLLLSIIAYLYLIEKRDVQERLQIYDETIDHLLTTLDLKKVPQPKRFRASDPSGWRKRDLLRRIAYDRLFPAVAKPTVERFTLSAEDVWLAAKDQPDGAALAEDLISTSLLSEIGRRNYAFAHLTLQEYLAAEALKALDPAEREKRFIQAYFDPFQVELEVLPTVLALVPEPDRLALFTKLLQLPESLSLTRLRLLLRSLGYQSTIPGPIQEYVCRYVLDIVLQPAIGDALYWDPVMYSLAASRGGWAESLVNQLSTALHTSESREIRQRVIEALERIGSESAVDALLDCLRDPREDAQSRLEVVEALGRLGSDRAVEELLVLLGSEDESLVLGRAILEALGQIGNERVVEVLVFRLLDAGERRAVRRIAAEALGRIGAVRGVEALVEVLLRPHNDAALFSSVARALELVDEASGQEALRRLGAPRITAAVAGVLGDPNRVHPRDSYRLQSLSILARLGSETAVRALESIQARPQAEPWIKQIKDPRARDEERHQAAAELGHIGSAEAVDALLARLTDANEFQWMRRAAVHALEETKSERAVDVLLDLFADPEESEDIRVRVAGALGRLGTARAVPSLVDRMVDPLEPASGRGAAAVALGRIGGDAVTRALRERQPGLVSSYWVRLSVVETLRLVRTEHAVEILAERLADPTETREIRRRTAITLGQIGSERAVNALLERLQDEVEEPWLRSCVAEGLGELTAERAIEALGRISGVRAVTSLLERLTDGSEEYPVPGLRRAAEVIRRLPYQKLSEGLGAALSSKAGEKFWFRYAVTSVVGYYMDDAAELKMLEKLAEGDPEPEVRKAAQISAGQIRRKRQYIPS
jgi:HEAT repeat protein